MHPVDFAKKWTGVTLTERSAAQQHVLDRCAVLDQPPPAAELKKRTLTNRSNARPTWLACAHAALDRAAWDACG